MSASLPWINSNEPIGMPNCRRSRMYGTAKSNAACMIPIGPPERTSRSESSPDISIAPRHRDRRAHDPRGCGSRRRPARTCRAAHPELVHLRRVVNPHPSFDHEGGDRRLPLAAGPHVDDQTSAWGPFVIHILVPLATHPPSTRRRGSASTPTTSEPASASLIASAPTCSPESSREPSGPLLGRAVHPEVVDAQVRVRRVRHPHRRRRARHLLDDHQVLEDTQPAPPSPGHRRSQHVEAAEHGPQLPREGVAQSIGREGGDLTLGEVRTASAAPRGDPLGHPSRTPRLPKPR